MRFLMRKLFDISITALVFRTGPLVFAVHSNYLALEDEEGEDEGHVSLSAVSGESLLFKLDRVKLLSPLSFSSHERCLHLQSLRTNSYFTSS